MEICTQWYIEDEKIAAEEWGATVDDIQTKLDVGAYDSGNHGDFFTNGTLDLASKAQTEHEADQILRNGYLGADCCGIGVKWSFE